MAMTVASRYAVLTLDEDDDYSSRKKKSPNKKPVDSKTNNTPSVRSDSNFKKKKKGNTQNQSVKNRNKSTNNYNEPNMKKEIPKNEQWEEWKVKDAQFVEGNYEDELSQAILLSKLEYEEKKHLYEPVKKGDDQKKNAKKNKKNQKFANNEGYRDDLPVLNIGKGNGKNEPHNKAYNKGKIKDYINQEPMTLAQYEEALERRDKEIMQLKEEVEKLKNQLHVAKAKNKKLCQIIANSEMKDKMEVLMEFERLQNVKDELSSEVVNLHAQLEQERSKLRALAGSEHKSKDKNKKKHLNSADSAQ